MSQVRRTRFCRRCQAPELVVYSQYACKSSFTFGVSSCGKFVGSWLYINILYRVIDDERQLDVCGKVVEFDFTVAGLGYAGTQASLMGPFCYSRLSIPGQLHPASR